MRFVILRAAKVEHGGWSRQRVGCDQKADQHVP